MKIILLLTALIGGAYYWYTQNMQIHALKKTRIKKDKSKATTRKTTVENKDFSCVVIQPDAVPCSAVRALDGTPILMREASALPLAGCYKTACNCRFKRYDDRRRLGNRRNESYLNQQASIDGAHASRRASKDRRRTSDESKAA